jgi:hypothetical protein
LPSSTSSWTDQFRNDCGETPSSRASCGTERSLLRNSLTASERNSNVYGGIFGITRHPSRPSELSQQMSTKAGELQGGCEALRGETSTSVQRSRQTIRGFASLISTSIHCPISY